MPQLRINPLRLALLGAAVLLAPASGMAQAPAGGPPAVGVIKAQRQPVIETNQFVGRIQATDRVALVARVTGFLEKRFFEEGYEVKKDQLLYRIEQPPFQADVDAKKSAVAQLQAQLDNANVTLQRAQTLLNSPAGQQSNVDTALANQKALAAQVLGAQAQLRQSQINLDYTEIHAPIDGRINRTSITEGNVVGASSGTLATIVSQDPMYVVFPVSVRAVLELRERYAAKGGYNAVVIKLKLPDGRDFGPSGKLNFVDTSVSPDTDTLILRGTIPNPVLPGAEASQQRRARELFDGEFVTVNLEGVQPLEALAIPRSAVLSDQQGDYIYVVDTQNKAQQRRIQLGQSTAGTAIVTSGLQLGETVIVEGLQRVRPSQPVSPGAPSPKPAAAATTGSHG
jgi:membrane fusion protein (multidrug efflux system)